MDRRKFIQVSAATGAVVLAQDSLHSVVAREPIARTGPPRFCIGLAAYSLRKYFSFVKGKTQTPQDDGAAIDMIGFLDYCVANRFEAAELTSYFFKPDADDDYFRKLKHEAFVRGVTISGTAIGNNFTVGQGAKLDAEIDAAMNWIDRAAILGAPHIRFFAGTAKQLSGEPKRLDEAAAAINHCAKHAASQGILLGIENHGQLTAEQMLQIMAKIESPWVGINLDTGNFISEDPYADLARCIGYAVNIQVKVNMKSPAGEEYPADLNRIGKILKDGGYQGFVVLEFESEDPYNRIPQAYQQLKSALA